MPDTPINPSLANSTANKNIPIYDIIDCIENKGLNQSQTAKLLDCHKSNVSARLKAIGYQPQYLEKYKNNRADILATYQQIILNSIDASDLKKAGLSQKIVASGILFDKERLERGQSTENIAYADMSRAQEIVDNRIKKFEEKYGISAKDVGNSVGTE